MAAGLLLAPAFAHGQTSGAGHAADETALQPVSATHPLMAWTACQDQGNRTMQKHTGNTLMDPRTLLLCVPLLAGCGNDAVHVHILPSRYEVGGVTSHLATPAVDEVVRLKPKTVHISTCYSTPHAKVIQFDVELQARLNAKVTGGLFEKCPES